MTLTIHVVISHAEFMLFLPEQISLQRLIDYTPNHADADFCSWKLKQAEKLLFLNHY